VATAAGLRIGFVQTDGKATTALGVDTTALQQAWRVDVVAGDLTGLTPDQVAINKDQAEAERRSVGNKVAVKFLDGGIQLLTVGAIYSSDAPLPGGIMLSHEGFAKRFPASLNLDNAIYVKLAPGADVGSVKAQLKTLVKQDFPTASVLDLTEYKESQVGFLNILLLIITVMLVLAVVIALLGIFNTLLLSIYERTREIGLLRAVGGSRQQVRTSIRWEAVIFSLQGTLIGIVIGFAFAWVLVRAIAEDTPLTFAVPTGQLIGMVVFALLAGLAAAVIPAWRASKLDILQAIATE
jgi:putative ABC transport system permease protein